MDKDLVKLCEAGSEQEAAVICGFLESNGIKSTYDKGGVMTPAAGLPWRGAAGLGEAYVGRQEILVLARDAERATKLLAEQST